MTPKRIKHIRAEIQTWPHEGDEYCDGICKHSLVEEVLNEVEKLQNLITAYHATAVQKEMDILKLRQELILYANQRDDLKRQCDNLYHSLAKNPPKL